MKTTVEAKIQNLPELIKLCQQLIGDRAVKSKSYQRLLVAIEEIFVNISTYAYGFNGGTVSFEIEYIGENRVRAEFADCGTPFNPLEFDSRQSMICCAIFCTLRAANGAMCLTLF